MPQAATHIIITLIAASIIRDFYAGKNKFPLHYVFIAGLAGLLPDLDITAYWILNFFGFALNEVHRTFTHTLFLPALFLILAFLAGEYSFKAFGKRHMTLRGIFLMIAFGSFMHLVLDASLAGLIRPFYPVSNFAVGFSIIAYLPDRLKNLFFPCLDAALLVIWLVYLELKHKISDCI
jgi:membrane-bound metal-dependent hydrolase YbcI (DUF457 family)